MRTKRFVIVREVVEWDSGKAYPRGVNMSDDECRRTAEVIAKAHPTWKVIEKETSHA